MLSVLAFFVSSSSASAIGAVIGHLQEDPPALNVTVNGQPAAPGAEIHQGDLIETGGNSAVINLNTGECVEVYANTRGRIYDSSGATSFVASRGGFRLLHSHGGRHDNNPNHTPGGNNPGGNTPGGNIPGGNTPGGNIPGAPGEGPGSEPGSESLPYLPGFNGNFSGTSSGGGGSSPGATITRVVSGNLIGVFDALSGVFLRFL